MILRDAINDYIPGARPMARSSIPAQACCTASKHVGGNTGCDAVVKADVLGFLAGNGSGTGPTSTAPWRLLPLRDQPRLPSRSPLPARDDEPGRPRPTASHVYSELQLLFRRSGGVLPARCRHPALLLPYMARGCVWASRRLTLDDADLNDALLTIRNTKFYKTRRSRLSATADALRAYAAKRAQRPLPNGTASTFLANRNGTPVIRSTVTAFAKLLRDPESELRPAASPVPSLPAPCRGRSPAGVVVPAGRRPPAVAPGSVISGTRVYLSMTPELLHEASVRFSQRRRP